MTTHEITPVILCGGAGQRLWPLSRAGAPKQLHRLTSDTQSMLQQTVQRTAPTEHGFAAPILVSSAQIAEPLNAQLAGTDWAPRALILEPTARNTAPAIAAAAALVAETDPGALMLVLPADHHVGDPEAFRAAVLNGVEAAQDGRIVTFGVRPDRPETGYGYIRRGEPLGTAHTVAAFVEKPDAATAERYVASGDYSWNAGVFLFRADTMLAEMGRWRPDARDPAVRALAEARRDGDHVWLDGPAFSSAQSISVDHAVMEPTSLAAVVEMDAAWSDVGSWASIWEASERDVAGNGVRGDALLLDCANTLAFGDGVTVTAVGVNDLAIIATRDAVLVAPLSEAQRVKDVVEALKAKGRTDLL